MLWPDCIFEAGCHKYIIKQADLQGSSYLNDMQVWLIHTNLLLLLLLFLPMLLLVLHQLLLPMQLLPMQV